jgi:hypothetical protein
MNLHFMRALAGGGGMRLLLQMPFPKSPLGWNTQLNTHNTCSNAF